MSSTSVAAGSAAKLNITAYNTSYSHRVTWRFGSYSNTQTVAAGTTSASYTIPLSWLNAIPSAVSGVATATLETLDAGGNVLGSSVHSFTITAPASVKPSIGSITAVAVNDNSTINGWGIYVYGKSKAKFTISSAVGSYGSTIKSYSITTTPNVGSGTASTLTTGYIYQSGTITATATVTDSRGRTATKTTTFSVYGYSAPYYSSVSVYRSNSSGSRDDVGGTYAYIKVSFGCSALSGSNTVTGSAVLSQVGGSYTQTQSLVSGIGYTMGNGSLASDATYKMRITLTDTVGTSSVYEISIPSAAYVMHVKKGGKAVGFGTAAGADNTVTFGWPIKLVSPLEVSQGGTGGSTAAAARTNIGAVNRAGDTMTGTLNVPFLQILSNSWNSINFADSTATYSRASIQLNTSENNRLWIVQKLDGYAGQEIYMFPATTSGRTSDVWYNILTSKNVVTVGQGGTGATSAAGARTNLGISAATINDTSTFVGTVYFYIGNILIQMGVTDSISVASKAYTDTVIT